MNTGSNVNIHDPEIPDHRRSRLHHCFLLFLFGDHPRRLNDELRRTLHGIQLAPVLSEWHPVDRSHISHELLKKITLVHFARINN